MTILALQIIWANVGGRESEHLIEEFNELAMKGGNPVTWDDSPIYQIAAVNAVIWACQDRLRSLAAAKNNTDYSLGTMELEELDRTLGATTVTLNDLRRQLVKKLNGET